MTRTKVTVSTRLALTGIENVKGIHDVHQNDTYLEFQADSEEMGKIIRYISTFDILKLECAPPTLEDLFIRHYRGSHFGKGGLE